MSYLEVLSRVISRITMVITYIRGLITPLIIITSHEPPSTQQSGSYVFFGWDLYAYVPF